jgi:hypothetical protein
MTTGALLPIFLFLLSRAITYFTSLQYANALHTVLYHFFHFRSSTDNNRSQCSCSSSMSSLHHFFRISEANPTATPLYRQEERTDPIIEQMCAMRQLDCTRYKTIQSPYRCENAIRTSICWAMLDISERALLLFVPYVAAHWLGSKAMTIGDGQYQYSVQWADEWLYPIGRIWWCVGACLFLVWARWV